MILFVKLLLAHLLGDFVLQPNSWVADKEDKKIESIYLYKHIAIHGLLIFLIVAQSDFWWCALVLAISHGAIDALKLYLQNQKTKRIWFILDQLLHLAVIGGICLLWYKVDFTKYEIDNRFWIYATAVLLMTTPASIVIKNIISIWTPNENGAKEADLQNAGKYIGILERLFVFFFVATGNLTSIGFLMAAKSIFRFGDLTQSKDRKLTEYVLIGTLISFGTAIGTGFLVQYALTLL
ncbi:MAG TPA: DUF3307 domain-containing protein [Flavobacterium sp.]|nr:DUF3307 domain-containing protein [Flavobacterium sp.]HPJ09679.1 DUF3307 domain-containing protein [Flavobacterium sp.]